MKIIIGAIALLIAAPVAAQVAPAADPHAAHAQHGQQHQPGQPGDHSQHGKAAGQAEQMGCCKDGKCCDMAKSEGKTMACCAKKGDDAAAHKGHRS